jgi:hypothetical protein
MEHHANMDQLRDEADRQDFAIRKELEQMAAQERVLERDGEAFEDHKDRAKRSIAAERRKEHWGHEPERLPR